FLEQAAWVADQHQQGVEQLVLEGHWPALAQESALRHLEAKRPELVIVRGWSHEPGRLRRNSEQFPISYKTRRRRRTLALPCRIGILPPAVPGRSEVRSITTWPEYYQIRPSIPRRARPRRRLRKRSHMWPCSTRAVVRTP